MIDFRVLIYSKKDGFSIKNISIPSDSPNHSAHAKVLLDLIEGDLNGSAMPPLYAIDDPGVYRAAGTELAFYKQSDVNSSCEDKYIFFRKVKSIGEVWMDVFPLFIDLFDQDIDYIKETGIYKFCL